MGPVFAIIIGIDWYKSSKEFSQLQGCVNDAKDFQKYLIDSRQSGGLEVPPANIQYFENKTATRGAILSTFRKHLIDNQDIPDHGNAAMIFYFAGHGSRVVSPDNLLTRDDQIEVICPYDERSPGDDGRDVTAIADYELIGLLRQLANKKGNNITVIIDSCHSGGMGRECGPATARSPTRPSLFSPQGLDHHGDASQSHHLWSASSSTHVLLAACSQGGKAYESADPSEGRSRGHFTAALVPALRRAILERNTNVDVVAKLPPLKLDQVPHCGGDLKDRVVFSTEYPVIPTRSLALKEIRMLRLEFVPPLNQSVGETWRGREFFVVGPRQEVISTLVVWTVEPFAAVLVLQKDPVDIPAGSQAIIDDEENAIDDGDDTKVPIRVTDFYQAFSVQTGDLSGVRPGTVFAIHNPTGAIVCSLVAKHVDGGETVLVSWDGKPVAIPQGSRAVVKEWTDKVRVYVPSSFQRQLFPLDPGGRCEQVKSCEGADICVRREGERVIIERLTGATHTYDHGISFPTPPEPPRLRSALSAAARFHYLLEHANERHPLPSGFALEMYRLDGEYPTRKPISGSRNLVEPIKASENLYMTAIPSDPTARYGFKIRNSTKEDLFAYLFYFNPDNYTIKVWYLPETIHERSLNKINGQMCVGLGGEPAFCFARRRSESRTGFIKLFVSTEYQHLAWIEQKSPWLPDCIPKIDRFGGGREFTPPIRDWDALTVVLQME